MSVVQLTVLRCTVRAEDEACHGLKLKSPVHLVGLTLVGHRHYGVGAARGHDHIDAFVQYQVPGHLRGAVGVGLAVDSQDLDQMLLAVVADDAVLEGLLGPRDIPVVGQRERGQCAGLGLDETQLQIAARFRGGRRPWCPRRLWYRYRRRRPWWRWSPGPRW